MHVTITAVVRASDATPDGPTPGRGSFIDSLVVRLHAEYGVDVQAIRSLAVEVLASFADARIQAFVPILVEKRLREICRGWA